MQFPNIQRQHICSVNPERPFFRNSALPDILVLRVKHSLPQRLPKGVVNSSTSKGASTIAIDSKLIAKSFQVIFNLHLQFFALFKLFFQLRSEPRHFVCEQFAAACIDGSADLASGCEDVVILADFAEDGGFSEGGGILIPPLPLFSKGG